MREQVLDGMELEREKGITIKAKAVRMLYGDRYILNLIDTPGHVDFTYEVSRALAACEGVLLVVDATQGIEAQTVANTFLAQEIGLVIIPVINKIDLPAAAPEAVAQQVREALHITEEPIFVSAKDGTGAVQVLEAIIKRVPPYAGDPDKPLSALIFDSLYDPYRGVIIYLKMLEGTLRAGEGLRMVRSGLDTDCEEVGFLVPKMQQADALIAGEVGYLVTGVRDIHAVTIGDTVTAARRPTTRAHPGYKELKPFVFVGLFPVNPGDYAMLKDAIEKLHLSDSSFRYEPETSQALGFGFRCGFLGLLHMDITKERLQREFHCDIIVTTPNVVYQVMDQDGNISEIANPAKFPPMGTAEIDEPYIAARIVCPKEYIGSVMQLVQERRGKLKHMVYITPMKVIINYEIPLGEVILDFYDQLKSVTRGYASLDYEHIGWRPGTLVKVEILLQGDVVDALSAIVHKDKAYAYARMMTERLRAVIPRQMVQVAIQARVNNRIVARETITAMRKDVIAKCYGGDISRKRKLLEKQKEGKRRMKRFAKVELPQEAFLTILNIDKR